MKPRLLQKGEQPRAGMVLARGVGQLQKGAILTEADLSRLGEWKELSVVEIEPGDVHEEAAGRRLAKAAAGENVDVRPLNAGSWPLAARRRGLVEVDAARLAELNDSDDLAVVTLPHGQIVVEDEIVARAKIVPFVTRETEVARAEKIGAVVSIKPFQRMRVAALVQENLDDESLGKFRAAFDTKVRFFGSELAAVRRVGGDLAGELRKAISDGAQLVVMAGSKLMDPLDPMVRALGESVVKHGVPLHPGTLLWVGLVEGVPVVGAPGCALFSKATAFDVLLPMLMAGEKLSRKTLARLGAGGLLTKEMAFRFPPYRPGAPRGEP